MGRPIYINFILSSYINLNWIQLLVLPKWDNGHVAHDCVTEQNEMALYNVQLVA